jgi:hypothetical protein
MTARMLDCSTVRLLDCSRGDEKEEGRDRLLKTGTHLWRVVGKRKTKRKSKRKRRGRRSGEMIPDKRNSTITDLYVCSLCLITWI